MRMGPDGAPDVVDVLEQAPLPLPTGPRETLDELQRANPTAARAGRRAERG